jgi:hypothetical protein
MIIWGSTGREIVLATGEFYCPQCDSEQAYKHIRVARYFTLYFIPLFPTQNLGEFVRCETCQQAYREEVLDYEPPSDVDRQYALVRADLESGTPIEMAQRKLLNAGMSQEAAAAVTTAAAGQGRKECTKCSLSFVASVLRCSNCGENLAS